MLTAGLRRAIGADDPQLRPGPAPGSYTSSLPFRLNPGDPRAAAAQLAARLGEQLWIAGAEVTGPGFVTVTVTHATLARLAIRIANAGPACAESDALAGRTVPVPQPAAVTDWPQARAALAAELTVPPAPIPRPRGRSHRLRRPGRRPVRPGPDAARRPAAGGGRHRAARAGQSGLCCSVRACRRCRRAALGRRAGDQASRVHAAPARRTGGAGAARCAVLAPGTGGRGGAPRKTRRVRRVPGGAGSAHD